MGFSGENLELLSGVLYVRCAELSLNGGDGFGTFQVNTQLGIFQQEEKGWGLLRLHLERYDRRCREPNSLIERLDVVRYFQVASPIIYTSKGLFEVKLLNEVLQANASAKSNTWWLEKTDPRAGVLQYVNPSESQQRAQNKVGIFVEHILKPLLKNIELARPKKEKEGDTQPLSLIHISEPTRPY